ncbi:MAG: hypothetical protein ACN6PV_13660 [Achromobacter sp.]|uniref:hypothetical protein n=1 Tax=Achromobacter sp. TaxID=134375 RepID=UPI003CFD29C4
MIDLPELPSVLPARRWALKILQENERPGGRRYSMTVLSMAKRALGIDLNVGESA